MDVDKANKWLNWMWLRFREHGHSVTTLCELKRHFCFLSWEQPPERSLCFLNSSLGPTSTSQPLSIPIKLRSAYNLSCSSPRYTINVIAALSSFQPSLASDHRKLPRREEKMDSPRLEWPLSRYTGAKTHRREEIKRNNDSRCLPFSVQPKESFLVADTVMGWQSYL